MKKGGKHSFQISMDIPLFLHKNLTSGTFIKVSFNVESVNSTSGLFVLFYTKTHWSYTLNGSFKYWFTELRRSSK